MELRGILWCSLLSNVRRARISRRKESINPLIERAVAGTFSTRYFCCCGCRPSGSFCFQFGSLTSLLTVSVDVGRPRPALVTPPPVVVYLSHCPQMRIRIGTRVGVVRWQGVLLSVLSSPYLSKVKP